MPASCTTRSPAGMPAMGHAKSVATPPAVLRVLVALATFTAAACTTMPRAPAGSCIQRTFDGLELAGLDDQTRHCYASGMIARQCGTFNAWSAGLGKELADLAGAGTASRADLRANRVGRDCARSGQPDLLACCVDSRPVPIAPAEVP